jgi:hypothetical protein
MDHGRECRGSRPIATQRCATAPICFGCARVRVCDISQGGVKIECSTLVLRSADVIVALPGLDPQPGLACWVEDGFIGISFNRLVPLGELVSWLHEQRATQRGSAQA